MIKELTVNDIKFTHPTCHLIDESELAAIITIKEVLDMVEADLNFVETRLNMGLGDPVKLVFTEYPILKIKAYKDRKTTIGNRPCINGTFTDLGEMQILGFQGSTLIYKGTKCSDEIHCPACAIDLTEWDLSSRVLYQFPTQEGSLYQISISAEDVGKIKVWKLLHAEHK